jgi:hypothetical protein
MSCTNKPPCACPKNPRTGMCMGGPYVAQPTTPPMCHITLEQVDTLIDALGPNGTDMQRSVAQMFLGYLKEDAT